MATGFVADNNTSKKVGIGFVVVLSAVWIIRFLLNNNYLLAGVSGISVFVFGLAGVSVALFVNRFV